MTKDEEAAWWDGVQATADAMAQIKPTSEDHYPGEMQLEREGPPPADAALLAKANAALVEQLAKARAVADGYRIERDDLYKAIQQWSDADGDRRTTDHLLSLVED